MSIFLKVKWPGSFPIFISQAKGSVITDVDGLAYIDFCLGDTGAMTGHSPSLVTDKLKAQIDRGFTTMLPVAEVNWVGEELKRRFKLPFWQICISATDANRFSLRIARAITKRPYVVVNNYCYHGTVDETFATLDTNGKTIMRQGSLGPQTCPSNTTRVVEYNDIDGLENALKDGQVACVLMEPCMTNIGIILPQPDYLAAVRQVTKKYGTLLILDETHCISAGPSGYTGKYGLAPDFLTIGKAIGAGIPAGAYGMTNEVAERFKTTIDYENCDVCGIGGTLSGNPLSIVAIKSSLQHILTEENFEYMIDLATELKQETQRVIDDYKMPWSVVQLGCRVEFWFCDQVPKNGLEAAFYHDSNLFKYIHLFFINRGILITPFHNMLLISPNTTKENVKQYAVVFRQAVEALISLE